MALILGEKSNQNSAQITFLSAGTDGVDGNSPAAGAVCDQATLTRAGNLKLDARRYLENSDSYSFFQSLGDAVVTGSTGTNVRDLRIMIAR
jgi:glycerate-2-kinase